MPAPPAPVTGNFCDKRAVRHPLERRVVARFDRRLTALVAARGPARVLEIGCGEGHIAGLVRSVLPDCRYVAADIDPALLGLARQRGADETVLLDPAAPTRLARPDWSFDLVLLVEVLEHVADPRGMLAEATRLGRWVIATVPFEPWWRLLNLLRLRYVTRLGNTPGHVNHWTRRGFARLLAGCPVSAEIRTVFPWLVATMEVHGGG
ncbi:MAG: class I SAM-dependent methyltransferase [bacterium]